MVFQGRLFSGINREARRCDYILITSRDNKKRVLFIELKSYNFSKREVDEKFMATEAILNYCSTILDKFYGEKNIMKSVEKRFVLFYKSRINKRNTRNGRRNYETTDSIFKVSNPREVPFNSLI